MTDNPWSYWLSDEEQAAGVRVVAFDTRYPVPDPVQLERFRVLGVTPILFRRPGSAAWYMGALAADGRRVDADGRAIGPVPDPIAPRPLDRQRRIALARDLHGRGFSTRAIGLATGWSKSYVQRLINPEPSAP